MKIVTVVGARPQFIKASALSRELLKSPDMEEVIIHTGQHFDSNMSDVFFEEMEIPAPKYQLDIHSLSHGAMTGRMMEEIEKVLLYERPDVVLVYGDTNSTLAGALAACKLNLKVAHVEAGLRSFNLKMPEEINRILTDRISDLLFCPTEEAVSNLNAEGFGQFQSKVVLSGDIMLDAALYYRNKADTESRILEKHDLKKNHYVLATIHRQENTDDHARLQSIIDALNELNQKTRVVVPLHPRTRNIIHDSQILTDFTIIEPVGYFDMISLISNATLIMTDSGGLQKEAYFFGKYCITLRDQTEWVELVKGGYNTLTGSDKIKILKAFDEYSVKKLSFDKPLYGDGHAAKIILVSLQEIM
ncbi:MAG: UDP-N-acetylglucosamine 2-epimerase (non-hydrolyzing) [Saprospiraceae bacterium]|nr:UDP-N-acetylglucosamine 2-epimerase (non-hydrolyzing) [Saprospiraceae bacterium]